MSKPVVLLLAATIFCSCFGKHASEAQKTVVTEEKAQDVVEKGKTVPIEISRSTLHWKGTKMWGAGKHEGQVELLEAYLITEEKQLIGGRFRVDMKTIGVSDIPDYETVPITNLNNHLKSPDFFDVEKFPTATFEITKVTRINTDSLRILGNLTIKDVTKNLEFKARYWKDVFSTRFVFDRFHWNIGYTGNFADNTLVDKDVELTIHLIVD